MDGPTFSKNIIVWNYGRKFAYSLVSSQAYNKISFFQLNVCLLYVIAHDTFDQALLCFDN